MIRHYYIGLMSGTSTDGIDAVVVAMGPGNNTDRKFELIAARMEPIPDELQLRIKSLMNPGNDGVDECGAIDVELGELFAAAALQVLREAKLEASQVRAIGSHGQTIRHRPNSKYPFSVQIGNPSLIAEITGITTVSDFRSRDIAAGGQGAPLVPAFHRWLFYSPTRSRAVVNIGGIANITHISTDGLVIGFDTGPGNTLLDQWILKNKNKRFDQNGEWAAGGVVSKLLLQKLLRDPYFAQPYPKSTGCEYFNMPWLEQSLSQLAIDSVPAQDIQATLVELTATTIIDGIKSVPTGVEEIFVCGGGSHNAAIMKALRLHADKALVDTTEMLDLHPDWVEACAFAWLAHCRLEKLPGNIPSVTGAKHASILGGIYAGVKDSEKSLI